MDLLQKKIMCQLSAVNTEMELKEFRHIFESGNIDNRKLENTQVVKLLRRLLELEDKSLVRSLAAGTELFRCRKLPIGDISLSGIISYDEEEDFISGYDSYDSKEPPITISGSARNNIQGASYLYLAEDEYTACAEIRPHNFDIISLAKFKTKRDLKMFDLTVDANFSQYDDRKSLIIATKLIAGIMATFYLPVSNDKEYLMSQYISDFIRKYGYDCICYLSSMTFNKNYTIFSCGENNIEFISSELVENHRTKFDLYKINDSSKISIKSDKNYPQMSAGELKERVIKRIREDEQWKH